MRPEDIKTIFEQRLTDVQFEVMEEDYSMFNKQITYFETIAQVQNSSVIVFDFFKRNYTFKHIHFAEEFGHNAELADKQGLAYYVSQVHPNDFPFILDTYIKALTFISDLPPEEKKNYKLCYNFRTKGKNNKYHWIVDQVVVLELDRDKNIWLLLGISDLISPLNNINAPGRQLVNTKTNKMYLFNDSKYDTRPVLSTREIEVLGLASKGFASKEIAEQLFISVNTVNNHRQKILAKTNTSNTSQAITFAKSLGII